MFNLSLSVIPTCFKQTTIVPVPKNTKVTYLNDYRPMSLTYIAMKCFERLDISVKRCSAALYQSGLYGRVARRKPLLSKRHMTAHLEFAKRHPNDSQTMRNRILCSDEIKIVQWSECQV
jgi:hypothetical protein